MRDQEASAELPTTMDSNGKGKRVVLVTGGSGLVGRCLQDEVQARRGDSNFCNKWEFVFLSSQDGDLTEHEAAHGLFIRHKPEFVIHLAAKVGGLFANMDDPADSFYKLNSQLNETVLKLSYDFKVKRCISCLSTCIFPDKVELPLDETKIHLGPPHESNSGYALAKRQVDSLNKQYNLQGASGSDLGAVQSPTKLFSVIPTNIYGPYDNFCARNSHVVPGLIRRAYETATSEAKLTCPGNAKVLIVRGSGRPLRQFIYAPDLARLLLWCLELDQALIERHLSQEPSIIMCPDGDDGGPQHANEVSIGQVASVVAREFSERFQIDMQLQCETMNKTTNASDGQYRKTASNLKLRKLLPREDFQFTPLERGLKNTIDWFCSHYPKVRGCS